MADFLSSLLDQMDEEKSPEQEDGQEERRPPEEPEFECPSCGNPLRRDEKKCPNCGIDINWGDEESSEDVAITEPGEEAPITEGGAEEATTVELETVLEGAPEAPLVEEEGAGEEKTGLLTAIFGGGKEGKREYAPTKRELEIAYERRINLAVRIGFIFLLAFLITYAMYASIWNEEFYTLNLFPFAILGLLAVMGIWLFLEDLKFYPILSVKAILTFIGTIMIGAVVIILLSGTSPDAGSFMLGFVGIIGITILILGRIDLDVKAILSVIIVITGVFFMLFVPINLAFDVIPVRNPTIIYGSVLMEPIMIVGLVLAIVGTFLVMRWTTQKSKTMTYFGIFFIGVGSLFLVFFHEAIGLSASGYYGPFDNSMMMVGFICVLLSVLLFADKKREDISITYNITSADRLQKEKKYVDAIKKYDKALSLDRKNEMAWCSKGAALRNIGRYQEAIQCFDIAIGLDEHFEDAWINKGNTLLKLHKYASAAACYNRVIDIAPEYEIAWNNKGNLLAEAGDIKKAIECYDKAIDLNKNYVEPLIGKGNALRTLGNYNEEIKYYEKALEIEPHNRMALNSKGNALESLGKHDAAIECYDQILGKDDKNIDALNNKALALSSLERYNKAIRLIERAIELNPNNDVTWANRGRLLRVMGELEEALKSVDQANQINPYSELARVYEGDILVALEKFENAERAYDKAIQINTNNSVAWQAKGDLLTKLGRNEEAEKCYSKAEQLNDQLVTRKKIAREMPISVEPGPTTLSPTLAATEMAAGAGPVESIAGTTKKDTAISAKPASPQLSPKEAAAAQLKTESQSMMKKLEPGFNYVVMEEKTEKTYELFRQFLEDGIAGFCITTTFPTKLVKKFGLEEAKVVWLSEASSEVETFKPKRLEFEIQRSINDFVKGNEESVILLDGFEYLVLENSFESVMKFMKKMNDLASMSNSTVMVPLNPNAFSREEMTILTKEFDRIEKR